MNTKSPRGTKARKKPLPARAKRIIISWVACFVIGGIFGGIVAVAVDRLSAAPAKANAILPEYGTRDGRVFNGGEMSMDWGGEYAFTPIDCALSEEVQEFTFYLCEGYYIDFPFAMAVMFCESSFRADIVSGTNDSGLMQINVKNHKWLSERLGLDDIIDPYQNIRAGLYILRGLFEKYDDPAKVLMAYNMGEYGASVLWEQGITETTYSRKVLQQADIYAAALEGGK
jgi:hypothetical protein